jgi:hypothetical protein
MESFALGEIVTLNNHPYYSTNNKILITADATMTPPLMVVTEVYNDYKKILDFDEKSGIQESNTSKIKCIFYSNKTHKYENNWFLIDQIKKISNINSNEEEQSLFLENTIVLEKENHINELINKNVILKSWEIELGKKKSSFSYDSYSDKNNNKITACLSFLPPVMVIIGVKKVDELKESNFDKKTGAKKRVFAKILVKCRWFNPLANAFSEEFFTPESLEIVIDHDLKLIDKIQRFIKENKFIRFNNPKLKTYNDGNTIGQPLKISFNHCYYQLEYFDFLTNKDETLKLLYLKSEKLEPIALYSKDYAPYYGNLKSAKKIKEFLKEEIEETKKINKVFRIQYKSKKGILSTRTISKCEFLDHRLDDINPDSKKNKYIKAKCFKREGKERHFRFKGIKKIEILDLNYDKESKESIEEISDAELAS